MTAAAGGSVDSGGGGASSASGGGRRDELIARISARLKRVCAHLSDDEFAKLVQRAADIQLKYEGQGAIPVRPSSAVDRRAGQS
ncbi:MAG: hypothetical protein WKG32_22420 [Gemmatimonadaceae bacterium]